jgi:hypothetical protein
MAESEAVGLDAFVEIVGLPARAEIEKRFSKA